MFNKLLTLFVLVVAVLFMSEAANNTTVPDNKGNQPLTTSQIHAIKNKQNVERNDNVMADLAKQKKQKALSQPAGTVDNTPAKNNKSNKKNNKAN